jgi:hypothetical protein
MRAIIAIIALCTAVAASGQIYIDSYRFGVDESFLLDDYPNAKRAYSLRLLRSDYTGNCVQVRRESDNTTLNIGFVGNYLDTASLKTFCSGTNCFVGVWYDQSTEASNAVTTTAANQPQIVSSGNLQYHNGKVVIFQTSSLQRLSITSITISSCFIVAKVDNTQGYNMILGSTSSGIWYGGTTLASGIAVANGGVELGSTIDDTDEHLTSVFLDASTDELFVDGVSRATGTISTFSTNIILRAGVSAYLNGKIKELVIYDTNQLSNNSAISTNINNFYSIY